jgi:putative oxidoreductase
MKTRKIAEKIFLTVNDNRSIIPRLVVGLVFLSEGIQKFIIPELVGAGRFEKIGFTYPEFWASFVATFEIICGLLIIMGFVIRLAAIPLLIIMCTALISTKVPILMEDGFWSMAHAARTDFSMTMLLIFLLIYGAGRLSVDKQIEKGIDTHD